MLELLSRENSIQSDRKEIAFKKNVKGEMSEKFSWVRFSVLVLIDHISEVAEADSEYSKVWVFHCPMISVTAGR